MKNKDYYFPVFCHSKTFAKGLFWFEYLLISIVIIFLFVTNLNIKGMINAIVIGVIMYVLMVRMDGRINLLDRIMYYVKFIKKKRNFKIEDLGGNDEKDNI